LLGDLRACFRAFVPAISVAREAQRRGYEVAVKSLNGSLRTRNGAPGRAVSFPSFPI